MHVCDLSIGLVFYCVGTEHVFALLLDGEGNQQRFELARCTDVFPRISTLMDAFDQPLGWVSSRKAVIINQFVNEWGASLLPPENVLRRFDVLIIVTHHFLHGLPLHLVRLGGEILATTHGISYCSSATLLHRCFERNRARRFDTQAWSFPLHGDGDRAVGPPVHTCMSCAVDVLTDKDIAYQKFASTFAGYFPGTSHACSRNDVKIALNPYLRKTQDRSSETSPDVICFVCHGHVDALHIDRSGLLLTGSPKFMVLQNVSMPGNIPIHIKDFPFAEIPVWMEPVQPSNNPSSLEAEMMSIGEMQVTCKSDAQLVALFGCSTGSGVVSSNDEYLSLATQWLKIGASSVIANLWEADLEVLTEWSHRFVDNWIQLHQPKAIAIREATRALLVDHPHLSEQPDLWGCIALFGDWL